MIKTLIGLRNWLDDRIPLTKVWQEHLSKYYAPKNFNFWYAFGVLSMVVLANQLITGIWLAMFYTPTAEHAFASIEYIMREVPYGWLLRYLHSTGASAFFIVVYLHMFRGLLYGSFKKPRELVWLLGMGLYFLLMAEAFFGYLLPWGQMSFWGAQVITSLFGAIPFVGDHLVTWIRGDYNVSGVTLNRFYAMHIVLVPLLMLFLVFLHIVALHKVGSNNPQGVNIKAYKDVRGVPLDGIPFHPYYTVKDLVVVVIFLILFAATVFFAPEMGGYFLEHANFSQANALQTPSHIAPVWYMTPYYAMLRAVPDKLFGVIVMGAAVVILFFLPWLDRCAVNSIRYRGWMCKLALTIFTISFIELGYLGTLSVTSGRLLAARVFTVLYFLFFFLMPIYTRFDKTKPVPERVK